MLTDFEERRMERRNYFLWPALCGHHRETMEIECYRCTFVAMAYVAAVREVRFVAVLKRDDDDIHCRRMTPSNGVLDRIMVNIAESF